MACYKVILPSVLVLYILDTVSDEYILYVFYYIDVDVIFCEEGKYCKF